MRIQRMVLLLVLLSALGAWQANAQPFVRITSPQPDQCVGGPNVEVRFVAGGMAFGPCSCNVHFMLDNEPFEVQYDLRHPHVFHDVIPGTHTIRAYATNAMHEAIDGTLDVVTFSVMYPDEENQPAVGEPLLTYNLPQGEYRGIDAADITLSFLVSGTCLGKRGYHVNYYVDGRRYIVYDCTIRHIRGLAPGMHTVRVDLTDEHNNVVPGPFNSTERTILLSPQKDPLHLAPGEAPPEQPVMTTIHGAMTGGLGWVAAPERPVSAAPERDRGRVRGTRPEFTVRPEGTRVEAEEAQVPPRGTDVNMTETEVDNTQMPSSSAETEPSVAVPGAPEEVGEIVPERPTRRLTPVDTRTTPPRSLRIPRRGRSLEAETTAVLHTENVSPTQTVTRRIGPGRKPAVSVEPLPARPTVAPMPDQEKKLSEP